MGDTRGHEGRRRGHGGDPNPTLAAVPPLSAATAIPLPACAARPGLATTARPRMMAGEGRMLSPCPPVPSSPSPRPSPHHLSAGRGLPPALPPPCCRAGGRPSGLDVRAPAPPSPSNAAREVTSPQGPRHQTPKCPQNVPRDTPSVCVWSLTAPHCIPTAALSVPSVPSTRSQCRISPWCPQCPHGVPTVPAEGPHSAGMRSPMSPAPCSCPCPPFLAGHRDTARCRTPRCRGDTPHLVPATTLDFTPGATRRWAREEGGRGTRGTGMCHPKRKFCPQICVSARVSGVKAPRGDGWLVPSGGTAVPWGQRARGVHHEHGTVPILVPKCPLLWG